MHPIGNIRGTLSRHLEGRTIVLAVAGSIAAVKTVELARELARHGADVVPVMSEAATRILHPDALEFATGHKPITRLTGAVEHVALMGQVKGKADLLLVAPATANTVSKMALGIDDTPITTFATVAVGTGTPIVVAPAMHEAMLDHPIVAAHQRTLVERLGVTWVEPLREEKKAKLADVESIVEAVIHRLANTPPSPGPLAGKKVLVVSGATEEPIDPVRILTNRSSGRSGHLIAAELHRLGADVTLWQGRASVAAPPHLAASTTPFTTHADLMRLATKTDLAPFAQVWMPAAIGDYGMDPEAAKIPSEQKLLLLELDPLPKVIEVVRRRAPKATLVAFKAESEARHLLAHARARLKRYGAQYVVANLVGSFGSEDTEAHLVDGKGAQVFAGAKARVLPQVVAAVCGPPAARRRAGTPKAVAGRTRKARK
ncbi:MAG TPA: bifunctional phosphopantothenoylcysteine decarboxylase/phosphopantothenate--cysteine ligase CoaBC [Candidatus Thermoplasmatota archaeon]|nr:bifunctional phosphopantothenoylcysteine decarboxylase/phosphopantothenate--cysteine ligase CoaBC [Candidatus Thermoplasmatota archaeon]